MAVDVVHIAWSGEAGSRLENRPMDIPAFRDPNTMLYDDSASLWLMDSRHISTAWSHPVLESSLENEGLR